jgi:hypothetical protein
MDSKPSATNAYPIDPNVLPNAVPTAEPVKMIRHEIPFKSICCEEEKDKPLPPIIEKIARRVPPYIIWDEIEFGDDLVPNSDEED